MKTNEIVTIDEALKILDISKRTLYQRIETGYYSSVKVGSILVDPKNGKPLTSQKLKSIPIRSKGRPAGKLGPHFKK